jgi:hypothetical protein
MDKWKNGGVADDENRFALPAQSAFVLSRWVRGMGAVCAPLLAALFAYGAWEIVKERLAGTGWSDVRLLAFVLATLAGLALLMLFALAWILRARLVLDSQGVELRGGFGARRIPWAKIEGFRRTAGRLFVFPAEDRWPLNLSYFGDQGLLLAWLHTYVPDLDAGDLAKEAEEIRADHSLGLMEKEKAARLGELRRIVKPVNWAGYVAAAIGGLNALFLGNDKVQLVTTSALVAVPVVLFLLALRFRDQVRLDYREGSLYPEGATGILASGVAIGLISLLDHHNTLGERFTHFVYPLAAATALLWLLLERRRIQAQGRWLLIALHVAGICFVSAFWAGGSVYQVNKNADFSEPVWDTTRVTALRKSQERTGTSYHATVAPWPASSEPVELDVSGETYESLRVGATVDISVRRGALEIPWVDEVRPKKQSSRSAP